MALSQHSSVKDIRLVLDRFTGAPRGFAFVHFHTVADASRVLHALQVPLIKEKKRKEKEKKRLDYTFWR